jgi:hypothetical protein
MAHRQTTSFNQVGKLIQSIFGSETMFAIDLNCTKQSSFFRFSEENVYSFEFVSQLFAWKFQSSVILSSHISDSGIFLAENMAYKKIQE